MVAGIITLKKTQEMALNHFGGPETKKDFPTSSVILNVLFFFFLKLDFVLTSDFP